MPLVSAGPDFLLRTELDDGSHNIYYAGDNVWRLVAGWPVKLLPLPQPQLRAHGRTDKYKRPESHSTKECARACVLCLKTEPRY
jgi:hypothetical protein